MNISKDSGIAFVQKYPIVIISLVVAILLLAWIYYRSGLRAEAEKELVKCSEIVNMMKANVANASQLQQQTDFLSKVIQDTITERSVDANNLALNLQYFYRLESSTGIKYLDLKQGTLTKPSNTFCIPLNFTMNIEGTFSQVLYYLRSLEGGVIFNRINSAVLDGSGDAISISINLDLLGVNKEIANQ